MVGEEVMQVILRGTSLAVGCHWLLSARWTLGCVDCGNVTSEACREQRTGRARGSIVAWYSPDRSIIQREKTVEWVAFVTFDCAFAVRTLIRIRSLLTASQFCNCDQGCCRWTSSGDALNKSRSIGRTRS